MQQQKWHTLRESVDQLATSLDDYSTYLRQQMRSVKQKQESTVSSASISDAWTLKVLLKNFQCPSIWYEWLESLFTALNEQPVYHKVAVNDFAPMNPKLKYQYIRDLEKGLPVPAILYTHTLGSSLGNYHFLWKILEVATLESATNNNIRLVDQIKKELPTYHTCALK